MSKLHSNFFMGLRYTSKKGKTHKIEKVEKTYIKGRRGVKFSTTLLTMTNLNTMKIMTKNMIKMK